MKKIACGIILVMSLLFCRVVLADAVESNRKAWKKASSESHWELRSAQDNFGDSTSLKYARYIAFSDLDKGSVGTLEIVIINKITLVLNAPPPFFSHDTLKFVNLKCGDKVFLREDGKLKKAGDEVALIYSYGIDPIINHDSETASEFILACDKEIKLFVKEQYRMFVGGKLTPVSEFNHIFKIKPMPKKIREYIKSQAFAQEPQSHVEPPSYAVSNSAQVQSGESQQWVNSIEIREDNKSSAGAVASRASGIWNNLWLSH